nr:MAG TPA: hypothetical protein [Caudoviricetes sp.]
MCYHFSFYRFCGIFLNLYLYKWGQVCSPLFYQPNY